MRLTIHTVLTAIFIFSTVIAASAAGPDRQLDLLTLPEWTLTSSAYGGKLLLSDSPEVVPADGIMYQDTVEGDIRLFFHHVNGATVPKKIVALLENNGTQPALVTVYRYGLAGPSRNWLAVGKIAQNNYLKGSDIYIVEVPAGGATVLSTELHDAVVEPDMLVNGIYDFKADRPVTVKMMMMPVHDNVKSFAAKASVLPADEHRLRGTFEGKDRMLIPNKVYHPAQYGPVAITLADNSLDRYAVGIDATDGSPVLNYGNYGIVYKLFLPSAHPGNISCYLNPQGGEYAGAIGVKYRHVQQPPVETPADRLSFGAGSLTSYAPVGTYESGQSLWLTFSPPGASNLPVKILIVPETK